MRTDALPASVSLTCPSCHARFVLRDQPRHARLRCLACRAPISGTASDADRWLYPLPAVASEASDETWNATAATLDPEETTDAGPGPRTVGRYALRDLLGRGGMGVVYDAWDPELERAVALKVLTGGLFASPAARTRFVGEARAAARLDHPGIVRVLDIGLVDGQPFFTMELVQGPSLREVVELYGPLPAGEAARIVEATARAVQAAHEAGIAHRDLKPANLMIDGDGSPRVADFGLAKPLDTERDLTATRALLGTPAYMAPEVARGDEAIDWIGVDVYGLGAVLFAALTGRAPAPGSTAEQQLLALRHGETASLDGALTAVPPALAAITALALRPDRSARYATAAELADDLARFLAGEAVHARPEGRLSRWGRRLRRHRAALATAAVVASAVVGALALPRVQDALEESRRQDRAMEAWEAVQERLVGADTETASALRRSFAEAPAHRGTVAAGWAWLDEGDARAARLGNDGNITRGTEPELEAWSRALGASVDPHLTAAVLLRLMRGAFDAFAFDDARALAGQLRALPLDPEQEDEVVLTALKAALFTGRTDEVEALQAEARRRKSPGIERFADPARIRENLGQMERVDLEVYEARGDLDDGEPRLQVRTDTEMQRIAFTPEPVVVGRLPLSEAPRLGGVWTDEGLRSREAPIRPGIWLDLDGDGAEEGYQVRRRSFTRLDPGPDGLIRTEADPAVTAANSELGALVGGDLDGDGRPELALGCAEWGCYDLRVYESDPAGGLALQARATRNAVGQLLRVDTAAGPRLLTAEHRHYPSRQVFGEDNPLGPPAAIVLWKVEEDSLVPLDTWELPTGAAYFGHTEADLDGDGHPEILFFDNSEAASHVVVVWVDPGGDRFEVSVRWGLDFFLVAQLDDDPGEELVGLSGEEKQRLDASLRPVWIAGRGTDPGPRQPDPPPRPTVPVPASVPGTSDEATWLAAGRLSQVGLGPQAARLLEDLARISSDADAIAALEAAADLWGREGVTGRAAEARVGAARTRARVGAATTDAFAAATEALLEAARPEEALALAVEWAQADGTGPTGALAETLAAWERATASALHPLDGPRLHPAWQIADPLALTHQDGAVVFDSQGVPAPVATLPLVWGDGPAMVALELTVLDEEWSSVASFQVGVGEHHLTGHVNLNGGGGLAKSTIGCFEDTQESLELIRRAPRGTGPERASIRIFRRATDAPWECLMALPDEARELRGHADFPPAAEGRLTLGAFERVDRTGAHERVRIDSLTLFGVVAGEASEDPLHRAHLALADGDPAEALRQVPADAPASRAVALAALRRPLEAVEALRAARGTESLERLLPGMLRSQGATFTPLLREALGADFLPAFDTAWRVAIATRRELPLVRDTLWTDLADVPLPTSADDPAWALLQARADAQLGSGEPERARRAAEDWLGAFEALPEDARTRSLRYQASALHRALSLLAERQGDAEDAARHAALSVALSPTPELARDRLTRGR